MKDNIIHPFWSFIAIIGVVIFALIGLIFQDVLKEIILVVCVVVFVYFIRRTIKLRKEIELNEQQQNIEKLLTDLSQNVSQLISLNAGTKFYNLSVEILGLFYILFVNNFSYREIAGIIEEIQNLAKNTFKFSLITYLNFPVEKRKSEELLIIPFFVEIKKRLQKIMELSKIEEKEWKFKTEFEKNFSALIEALKKVKVEKISQGINFSLDDLAVDSLVLLEKTENNPLFDECLPKKIKDIFLVLSIKSFLPNDSGVTDLLKGVYWKKIYLLSLRTGQEITWRYCKKANPELLNLGEMVSFQKLTIGKDPVELVSEENLPKILITRMNVDYHSSGGQVFSCYFDDAIPMMEEKVGFDFISYQYLSSAPYSLIIEYYTPLFEDEWVPIYFVEKIDIQNVRVLSI